MNSLNLELLQGCGSSRNTVCLHLKSKGQTAMIYVGQGHLKQLQGCAAEDLPQLLLRDDTIVEVRRCSEEIPDVLNISVEQLALEMCQIIDESRILTTPQCLKKVTLKGVGQAEEVDADTFQQRLANQRMPLNFSTSMTKQIIVGRGEECDIHFTDDMMISRRHAVFYFQEGELFVEDLKSFNGTYLNRRLVSKSVVHTGDEIIIGSHAFDIRIIDLTRTTGRIEL